MAELDSVQNELEKILQAELFSIVEAVKNPDFMVKIPSDRVDQMSTAELEVLVAQSSNCYVFMSRLLGIANSYAKLAKGAFDRAYKTTSVQGKNAEDRQAQQMTAALSEHQNLVVAESIAALAAGLESGARIASESARKLLSGQISETKSS